MSIDLLCGATSKEQGWRTVVRALASHQSQWPKFKSWRRRHMWFEFVFGFLTCSKRFFYGYSGFPFFSKTNAALPNSNSFWNAWTRFNLSTYYNLPSQLWVAIKLTAASDLPCMKTSKVEIAKGCFFPQIWKIWEICLWQIFIHSLWRIANSLVRCAHSFVFDSSQLVNKNRTHSPTMK